MALLYKLGTLRGLLKDLCTPQHPASPEPTPLHQRPTIAPKPLHVSWVNPMFLDNRRPHRLLWRIHRPLVEHGHKTTLLALGGVRPSVAPFGCGVPDKVKDLDIAFPNRLALKRFLHWNGLYPGRFTAVEVTDGLL